MAKRLLGAPVEGLSRIAAHALDARALRPADVLLLLNESKSPAEPALATLDGKPLWVWHNGVATGNGYWLVGDHFAGRTIEASLAQYLVEHPGYPAVLRGELVKPDRCRKHAPLKPPPSPSVR